MFTASNSTVYFWGTPRVPRVAGRAFVADCISEVCQAMGWPGLAVPRAKFWFLELLDGEKKKVFIKSLRYKSLFDVNLCSPWMCLERYLWTKAEFSHQKLKVRISACGTAWLGSSERGCGSLSFMVGISCVKIWPWLVLIMDSADSLWRALRTLRCWKCRCHDDFPQTFFSG